MRYLPLILITIVVLFGTVRANWTHRSILQRVSIMTIAVYFLFVTFFCFMPSNLSTTALDQLHAVWIGLAPTNSIPFAGGIGLDFFLNILMTIPLGIYFGLFYKKSTFKTSLQLGLLTGLTIESTQFLADQLVNLKRWVDINDILTNCLGVLIGYGLFVVLDKLMPKVIRAFELTSKDIR